MPKICEIKLGHYTNRYYILKSKSIPQAALQYWDA
jgi:hypothetical protein